MQKQRARRPRQPLREKPVAATNVLDTPAVESTEGDLSQEYQGKPRSHALTPDYVVYLQRTAGNEAVQRLMQQRGDKNSAPGKAAPPAPGARPVARHLNKNTHSPAEQEETQGQDSPSLAPSPTPQLQRAPLTRSTPVFKASEPVSEAIQRALWSSATLVTRAGPKSKRIGSSTYDKIVNGLADYPRKRSNTDKLKVLTGLKKNIRGWLTKNANRTKPRDNDKKRHLPELEMEVDLETKTVAPDDTILPERMVAFASKATLATYVQANIGQYDAIKADFNKVFPNHDMDKLLIGYFQERLSAGTVDLTAFRTLVATFSADRLKKLANTAFKNIRGYDIMLDGLEIPAGNERLTPVQVGQVKTIWNEVMSKVKYDSLNIPLQFIEKVRTDRATTPAKTMAQIYNEYNANIGVDSTQVADVGKADCVGMANEVKRRLAAIGIGSHVVGSTGGNYLNRIPNATDGALKDMGRFQQAIDWAVFSHASVIVPYLDQTGAPKAIHLETANGPDPANIKEFTSLAEAAARGNTGLKGDISTEKPITDPAELAKKHIRVKWRLYLTDSATGETKGFIDLIEGSIWLSGTGKEDMEVAKTFGPHENSEMRGVKFNFEQALKQPDKVVTLSIKDHTGTAQNVPKTNLEAVTLYFTLIKREFNLPDSFVQNMLYLSTHMDEFAQDVLLEPIGSLRKVLAHKKEALRWREQAKREFDSHNPKPAGITEEIFGPGSAALNAAHNLATQNNVEGAKEKYEESIALYKAAKFRISSRAGIPGLVRTHAADPVALEREMMLFVKNHPNESPVENEYNTLVPPLGLVGVPLTLGELVSGFFEKQFRARGNAAAVYQELIRDYPAFSYRVKPAYRGVFGQTQLKTMLRGIEAQEMAAAVPDPTGLANQTAKATFLGAGPYRAANFVPSTGIGAKGFDAEYDPTSGALTITVKVTYEFKDKTEEQPVNEGTAPTVGPDYRQNTWSPTQKDQWKLDYVNSVLRVWNATPSLIRCIRPGWTDVTPVRTQFAIREVTPGQEHVKIVTTKAVLTERNSVKKLASSGLSGQSGEGVLLLQQWDHADKIADPAVHRYLHDTEKKGNIEPAFKQDRARHVSILEQFGKLVFQPGSDDTLVNPGQLTVLKDEIRRLGVPSTLAHLHPIDIVGNVPTGGDPGLALRRATFIRTQLSTAGVTNALNVSAGTENYDGVVVKAAAEDPAILDTYVTNWERITAAHEFGHMIGLMDEYYQAGSEEIVKKLISDGMLPPSTPGDHLSRNPPSSNVVNQAKKQAKTLQMLEANDIEAPALTVGKDAPKTTNLMTGGFAVDAKQYITAWEVLTHLTKNHLDSKFWKIR